MHFLDLSETFPVAYIKNISVVMAKYVQKMSAYFLFDKNKTYQLRVGVDKGADDTKVTLSFGNMQKCQSPFSQIVVGCFIGSFYFLNLKNVYYRQRHKCQSVTVASPSF